MKQGYGESCPDSLLWPSNGEFKFGVSFLPRPDEFMSGLTFCFPRLRESLGKVFTLQTSPQAISHALCGVCAYKPGGAEWCSESLMAASLRSHVAVVGMWCGGPCSVQSHREASAHAHMLTAVTVTSPGFSRSPLNQMVLDHIGEPHTVSFLNKGVAFFSWLILEDSIGLWNFTQISLYVSSSTPHI